MLLELRCPSILECSFICNKMVKTDMNFNAVHMNIIKMLIIVFLHLNADLGWFVVLLFVWGKLNTGGEKAACSEARLVVSAGGHLFPSPFLSITPVHYSCLFLNAFSVKALTSLFGKWLQINGACTTS